MEYKSPDALFYENLEEVNGIKFSCREIDIMSSILSGKSVKAIASSVAIAPRTVETHLRNIMRKIDCNSRDGIINFIEKSCSFEYIKAHYYRLLKSIEFEECLKTIASFTTEVRSCSIVYWPREDTQRKFIQQLKKHFTLIGIKASVECREQEDFCEYLSRGVKNHTIYIMPEDWRGAHLYAELPQGLFVFLYHREDIEGSQKLWGASCIDFSVPGNYYDSFFQLFKNLFPDSSIDHIIEGLKNEDKSLDLTIKEEKKSNSLNIFNKPLIFIKKINFKFLAIIFIIFAFPSVGYFLKTKYSAHHYQTEIRSDLKLLHPQILLNRPEILSELKKNLQGRTNIEAVALVGTGGAGKTALARQYAHQQKESIIWEINAETQSSLLKSFEDFAKILAKSEESKKTLSVLLEGENPMEREEKILAFVQEHLRASKNWLLIFDNVEKFSDIQKHFPRDSKIWGEGKIILTTRDSNIGNSHQINHAISIGELSREQKLNLFTKIMHDDTKPSLTSSQLQETKEFLANIPSFPLDVSIAAYYLKTIKIPCKTYLEHLKTNNSDFKSVQENLLKEAGPYVITRFDIITSSVKKLIATHQDFEELLLFISLLDSQNIPRALLDKYKTNAVVDNFIHNLKKYSLITSNGSYLDSDPTFSMHRSTQAIILAYLRKKLDLENNKKTVHHIGLILEKYVNGLIENLNYPKLREMQNHCQTYLNHSDFFDDSTKGAITAALGSVYFYQFAYMQAQHILEKALEILSKNPDKNHNRIAQTLYFFGHVSWKIPDYEKAAAFYEQSIMTYKKHSSENQIGLARSLVALGNVTRQLGRYEKSKKLLEQALSIYKDFYQGNHVRIAESLSFLGATYYKLGEYEKAQEILEKSLSLYEKYYSAGYIDLIRIFSFLSPINVELRHYRKAKLYAEKGLEICKKQLPTNHVSTTWCLAVLGNAYKGLHDYEKAKRLLKNVLDFRENYFGKDHFETAKVLRDLGDLYLLENDIKTSEDFMQRSLSIFHKTRQVEIYTVYESLADLHTKKADFAGNDNEIENSKQFRNQAIGYLKQALEIITTGFPETSPHRVHLEMKLKKFEAQCNTG